MYTFSFPGASDNYTLPSGDTLRIVIRYDVETGGITSTDIDIPLIDIGTLNIPLETSPSDKTFRFSYIDMIFNNLDSIFDSSDAGGSGVAILDPAFADDTYIDIYLNGSIWWRGLIDFKSLKHYDYRYDSGGSFIYEKLKFRSVDVLSYFWTRSVTMDDASYTADMSLTTLLENIIGLVDFSAGSLVCDTNFLISEECGTEYDFTDLHITDMLSTDEISTFLKTFILGLGAFIYNLNNAVYIVLRTGGDTTSVTSLHILDYQIKENANYVEYISLSTTLNTISEAGRFLSNFFATEITFSDTRGTQSKLGNANVVIDGTGGIDKIITIATGTAVQPGGAGNLVSSGTDTTMTDSSHNFNTYLIESGDLLDLIDDDTGTFVEKLNSATQLQFTACGVTPALNDHYNLYRGYDGTDRRRYKVYRLLQIAIDVLEEFYQTDPNVYQIELRDVSAWDDIYKRYTVDGDNYRVRNAKFDLVTDSCEFEMVKVV